MEFNAFVSLSSKMRERGMIVTRYKRHMFFFTSSNECRLHLAGKDVDSLSLDFSDLHEDTGGCFSIGNRASFLLEDIQKVKASAKSVPSQLFDCTVALEGTHEPIQFVCRCVAEAEELRMLLSTIVHSIHGGGAVERAHLYYAVLGFSAEGAHESAAKIEALARGRQARKLSAAMRKENEQKAEQKALDNAAAHEAGIAAAAASAARVQAESSQSNANATLAAAEAIIAKTKSLQTIAATTAPDVARSQSVAETNTATTEDLDALKEALSRPEGIAGVKRNYFGVFSSEKVLRYDPQNDSITFPSRVSKDLKSIPLAQVEVVRKGDEVLIKSASGNITFQPASKDDMQLLIRGLSVGNISAPSK